MTSFQYLIDAFLSALGGVLPIPRVLIDSIHRDLLQWEPSPALHLFVSWLSAAYLLYFFRFDFLGIISAILKSIFQPQSLKAATRTLDQQIVIFLSILFAGFSVLTDHLNPLFNQWEGFQWNGVRAALLLFLAFGYHFARNWNKRIKGLNHVKISDAWGIGGLILLSGIDGLPWLGLIWIGMALHNYHYEAIFKYSALLAAMRALLSAIQQSQNLSFADALAQIGYLNSIAASVVILTTVYMTIEYLQKSMTEQTLRLARNWSIVFALYFGVLHFL